MSEKERRSRRQAVLAATAVKIGKLPQKSARVPMPVGTRPLADFVDSSLEFEQFSCNFIVNEKTESLKNEESLFTTSTVAERLLRSVSSVLNCRLSR
uniref:Uncharacterized protein n=1 Tax=Caenorhabditis japonica TaxID=281687 RepID=A0A8R1ECU2_CAEJA